MLILQHNCPSPHIQTIDLCPDLHYVNIARLYYLPYVMQVNQHKLESSYPLIKEEFAHERSLDPEISTGHAAVLYLCMEA